MSGPIPRTNTYTGYVQLTNTDSPKLEDKQVITHLQLDTSTFGRKSAMLTMDTNTNGRIDGDDMQFYASEGSIFGISDEAKNIINDAFNKARGNDVDEGELGELVSLVLKAAKKHDASIANNIHQ